jgi:hypothetical protein
MGMKIPRQSWELFGRLRIARNLTLSPLSRPPFIQFARRSQPRELV